MVSSSLVTEEQLKRGVESLTRVLEKRYELDAPHDDDEMSDVDDSNLGFDFLPPVSSVRAIDQAKMEVNSFLRYYKKQSAMPKFKNTSTTKYLYGCDSTSDATIAIGQDDESEGDDLPSGKNYAHYFSTSGPFDYIKFLMDHKKEFPKLWSYAIEKASCNPTEVACETLFSESGYASNARRTKLKSTQFEREVIVAHNLQNVYFDFDRAVDIFMKREKNKVP